MFRKTQDKQYKKPERAVVPYNPTTDQIPPFMVEDLDEKLDTKFWDDHPLSRSSLFGFVGKNFINPIWTSNDPKHPYEKALNANIPPFKDRGCKMALILSHDKSVGFTLKHDFSQILSARKNAVELRYTIENYHSSTNQNQSPSTYASPRRKQKSRQNFILCSMDLIGRWNRDDSASIESLTSYCEEISVNPSTKEHTKFFSLFEKRIMAKGSKLSPQRTKSPIGPIAFLTNLFKSPLSSTTSQTSSSNPGPFKNIPQDVLFTVISFLDATSFAKLMQSNKFFAQLCQDEKAFKTQCETILHAQPLSSSDKPGDFGTWKEYFHNLASYHYVRLVATLNAEKNDFEYLIVDVNLNPFRKIAVHAFPDWAKNNEEVRQFLAARPGYID